MANHISDLLVTIPSGTLFLRPLDEATHTFSIDLNEEANQLDFMGREITTSKMEMRAVHGFL